MPRLVELQPADQPRYRDTAWADTKAILGHRAVAVLVAIVALIASVIAAFVEASTLSVFLKILLAALAAGTGALIILGPLVFLGSLIAAPHRQRKAARNALGEANDRHRDALAAGETSTNADVERQREVHEEDQRRLLSELEQARTALAQAQETNRQHQAHQEARPALRYAVTCFRDCARRARASGPLPPLIAELRTFCTSVVDTLDACGRGGMADPFRPYVEGGGVELSQREEVVQVLEALATQLEAAVETTAGWGTDEIR